MCAMAATDHESSLLTTLDEIRSWTCAEDDDHRVLTNIACLIGNQLQCHVCSVYVFDAEHENLILAATVGLRQDCVGKVQLSAGDGLVGWVAERGEAVVLSDHARTHERFHYFPEAGEDPYDSFLGVPICDGADLLGVLVVQTIESRHYSAAEVQLLNITGRHLGRLCHGMRELEAWSGAMVTEARS